MHMCVCFQAEDGIRDLVRSRGLGDVYKSQLQNYDALLPALRTMLSDHAYGLSRRRVTVSTSGPVSYTHLTLPTSDLV